MSLLLKNKLSYLYSYLKFMMGGPLFIKENLVSICWRISQLEFCICATCVAVQTDRDEHWGGGGV